MPEQPEPELTGQDAADVEAMYRTAESFTPPPATAHSHITSAIAGWLVAALREYAMGERIGWDIGFQLMPTPQGPGPVFVLYLQMPSSIVGHLLVEMVVLEPRAVSEDNVRAQVHAAVGRLVEARSRSVAGLN